MISQNCNSFECCSGCYYRLVRRIISRTTAGRSGTTVCRVINGRTARNRNGYYVICTTDRRSIQFPNGIKRSVSRQLIIRCAISISYRSCVRIRLTRCPALERTTGFGISVCTQSHRSRSGRVRHRISTSAISIVLQSIIRRCCLT